jgi:hypothetical protein
MSGRARVSEHRWSTKDHPDYETNHAFGIGHYGRSALSSPANLPTCRSPAQPAIDIRFYILPCSSILSVHKPTALPGPHRIDGPHRQPRIHQADLKVKGMIVIYVKSPHCKTEYHTLHAFQSVFIKIKPLNSPLITHLTLSPLLTTLKTTPPSVLLQRTLHPFLSLSLNLQTTMVKPTIIVVHFTIYLFILHLFHSKAYANPDLEALMAFKAASDTANKLTSWNSTSNPCDWSGVSCVHNRVSRLVLEDLDLRGSFEPITALTQLRVLSLKRNRLSGHIPDLSNLTALKLLFLSGNDFSGQFPPSVPTLSRLYRLDLSYNNLSGEIPVTINGLTRLLTLRLEENRFFGSISGLNLLNLQDFNVSGNQLSGEVPRSLSGFPESAFAQNPALCGSPMQKCKNVSADPTRPGSDGAIASPLMPATNPNTIVASSPSSLPSSSIPSKSGNNHHAGTSKLSPVAIVAIILGDVLVLAVVSLVLYCYFWRSYATKMRDGKGSKLLESEKIVYSSSPYTAQPGFERGRMVFFEGVKRFELEDLLRASAEMLGKGGFGTAYKAVLDDGNVVAVKRLKDASVGGKREFEQHMELLGRLRHPNVVSLRAYYFAREEKLLVYDYMPNGSLFWLLHGMFPFFTFAILFFFLV